MPTNTTGLLSPPEQECAPGTGPELSDRSATAAAARHQPGAAWITDAMVEDTRRHWSPRYGYELSDAEAVEILMNVKRLAQILMKNGGHQK